MDNETNEASDLRFFLCPDHMREYGVTADGMDVVEWLLKKWRFTNADVQP